MRQKWSTLADVHVEHTPGRAWPPAGPAAWLRRRRSSRPTAPTSGAARSGRKPQAQARPGAAGSPAPGRAGAGGPVLGADEPIGRAPSSSRRRRATARSSTARRPRAPSASSSPRPPVSCHGRRAAARLALPAAAAARARRCTAAARAAGRAPRLHGRADEADAGQAGRGAGPRRGPLRRRRARLGDAPLARSRGFGDRVVLGADPSVGGAARRDPRLRAPAACRAPGPRAPSRQARHRARGDEDESTARPRGHRRRRRGRGREAPPPSYGTRGTAWSDSVRAEDAGRRGPGRHGGRHALRPSGAVTVSYDPA